jgi:esterase/lipase superfamily enzyme
MRIKTELGQLTILTVDGVDFLYNTNREKVGRGTILYSKHQTDNPNFIDAEYTKPEIGMYLILFSNKEVVFQSSKITQIDE